MRSLGEFFGHIMKGVRTNPSKKTIRKTIEEEQRGDVVLRRTTIEEVELKRAPPRAAGDSRLKENLRTEEDE